MTSKYLDAAIKMTGKQIADWMRNEAHRRCKMSEPASLESEMRLLARIYDIVKAAPSTFEMNSWHSAGWVKRLCRGVDLRGGECGSTHCMAGWAHALESMQRLESGQLDLTPVKGGTDGLDDYRFEKREKLTDDDAICAGFRLLTRTAALGMFGVKNEIALAYMQAASEWVAALDAERVRAAVAQQQPQPGAVIEMSSFHKVPEADRVS